MTKGEAIKYLQQLYPKGGHCWLDEQRIEAIGMAIKALQEEPVSEDLEYASEKYACRFSSSKYGHDKVKDAFIAGAKLDRQQMLSKAIDVKINRDTLYDLKPFIHEKYLDYKIGDKCKMILIKED